MYVFILGIVVIVVTVILASVVGQSQRQNNVDKPVEGDELEVWPFTTLPIMTDTEVLFYTKLQQAIPDYYIFCQVQLSRIIEPSEDAQEKRSFWLNRICRQSVDYILVDRDAQTILLAIELDDWTHGNKVRQKADKKKDKALASAGIPILRYHSEKMPSINIIKQDVDSIIEAYWQQ